MSMQQFLLGPDEVLDTQMQLLPRCMLHPAGHYVTTAIEDLNRLILSHTPDTDQMMSFLRAERRHILVSFPIAAIRSQHVSIQPQIPGLAIPDKKKPPLGVTSGGSSA